MSFVEVISIIAGLLQFIVAGYALRLNRIFGTSRVGWSLFWAFSLLALLHVFQSVTSFNSGVLGGGEIEVIYALIALLLLTGMVHIETLLIERLRLEQEEKRMRDGLELLVSDRTANLTKAVEDLRLEIAERTRAEASLRHSERALKAISACNQALIRTTTEPALLQEICRVIVEVGGYQLAWVGLVEHDEKKTVRPAAHAGLEEGYLDKVNITWADTERGRGPTGTAIRTKQPAACRNMLTDPSYAPWREDAVKRGYNSSLVLPLLEEEEVFGALNIYAAAPDAFDRGEVKLLTELAEDLAHGIMALRARVERQRTESALATEQRLLNGLITATPDIVYFKDRESRFIRINEAFARRQGLSDPREILGKTDFDLFGKEHAAQAHADEQQIMATGQPMIGKEEKEDWADGHVTWVSSTKLPLRDSSGKIVGVMGISRDITERKRVEEHVREQAALLDLAFNAIVVRDLEDHIQYWNKSAERIYGWAASEVIGRTMEQLLHADVFSASKYQEAGKAVMEKGDWQGEIATQAKNGKEVIVEAHWTLVRDSQGKPKSVLAISTDVTNTKKLEAQFLRSQRMESLGTLAGGIGHDLNNILTPLLVSVQVMKGKISEADRQKLLDALEANVQRGAGLVKQVLAFGRGLEGYRAMIQLKHIAREIKQMVQETFPKSVGFELHTMPDLWNIIGDPTQLHQVLLNLCVNARDAMPEGGKLSIHIENVMLDETYVAMNLEAKVGPYVVMQVMDTGPGIPKAIQEKIFDPYFTTKEHGKGTGLGLSTTLAIVKSHGGFIHCHSALGQGTTFKVYLPASLTPVAEKAAGDPSKLSRGHNELVLIVDDEEPILQIAQKTLERFGYRVLLATDGAEAVSLYASRQRDIAVVITDVAMPHLDGPATIAALKTMNPKVKIIGSSGLSSDGGKARIKAAGIRYFIPKPYTAEAILQALHEILQERPEK